MLMKSSESEKLLSLLLAELQRVNVELARINGRLDSAAAGQHELWRTVERLRQDVHELPHRGTGRPVVRDSALVPVVRPVVLLNGDQLPPPLDDFGDPFSRELSEIVVTVEDSVSSQKAKLSSIANRERLWIHASEREDGQGRARRDFSKESSCRSEGTPRSGSPSRRVEFLDRVERLKAVAASRSERSEKEGVSMAVSDLSHAPTALVETTLRMAPFLTTLWAPTTSMVLKASRRNVHVKGRSRTTNVDDQNAQDVTCLQRLGALPALDPDGTYSTLHDFLSIAFLLYDVVVFPVVIAWDLTIDGGLLVMWWITSMFWLSDLLKGGFTGYFENEEKVDRLRQTIPYFVKSRLLPDLTLVILDVGSLVIEASKEQIAGSQRNAIKFVRLLKINRLLRLLVILRLGKFGRILERAFDRFGGELWVGRGRVVAGVSTLVAACLLLVHWLACLWGGVANLASPINGNGTWLDYGKDYKLDLSAMEMQYATALQFVTAIIFGGPPTVLPTNFQEMIMTVFFCVGGALFNSVLFSFVTTKILEIQAASAEQTAALNGLREFLRDNGIPTRLAITVINQARDRMRKAARPVLEDLSAASILSTQLKLELKFNLLKHHVTTYPFFGICDYVDDAFLRQLVTTAVKQLRVGVGDEIFADAQPATDVAFLAAGKFCYRTYTSTSSGPQVVSFQTGMGDSLEDVGFAQLQHSDSGGLGQAGVHLENNWAAELAFFVEWTHCGELEAESMGEVLLVNVESYAQSLRLHPEVMAMAIDFSQALIRSIDQTLDEELTDLSLGVDYHGVMLRMSTDKCIRIGQALVESAQNNLASSLISLRARPRLMALAEEVNAGKCLLCLHEKSRTMIRVQMVAALRLERYDGSILVDMGSVPGEDSDEATKVNLKLPGCKVELGQDPGTALQKIFNGQLVKLKDQIVINYCEVSTTESASESFGLHTKYIRSIFHAKVAEEADTESDLAAKLPIIGRATLDLSRAGLGCHDIEAVDLTKRTASGTATIFAWVPATLWDSIPTSGAAAEAAVKEWLGHLTSHSSV